MEVEKKRLFFFKGFLEEVEPRSESHYVDEYTSKTGEVFHRLRIGGVWFSAFNKGFIAKWPLGCLVEGWFFSSSNSVTRSVYKVVSEIKKIN